MTKQNKKTRKVKEEAYLVMAEEYGRPTWHYFPTKKRAKEAGSYELFTYPTKFKVIPCTITYTLPTKKPKK